MAMRTDTRKGFITNIEDETRNNTDYRRVLYTAKHSQVVLMNLRPGEEIGMEAHDDGDQFFRFEEGQGRVIINGHEFEVSDGSAAIVPSGAMHNVVNTGPSDLKLYTIYSPPQHRDKVVESTKDRVFEEHFDGRTTE
ncbi:MAG: cupin domain-containing protein [Candidatus Saccharibacteria bacterium]